MNADPKLLRQVVSIDDRIRLLVIETERLARDMEALAGAFPAGTQQQRGSRTSLNRVISLLHSNCIRLASIVARHPSPPQGELPSTVIDLPP